MIYICILCLSLFHAKVIAEESSCKVKITAKYPNAKCVDVDDIDDCKAECEHLGEKQCKGKRGEITKLNCRDENESSSGRIPCCCE